MIKILLIPILLILTSVVSAEPTKDNVCELSDNLVCGSSTEIIFVGDIGDNYKIYNYTYIFGEAQRAANRILITNKNDEFIGMYAPSELAKTINKNCIIFDVPETYGNSICLVNGVIPIKGLIDGEPVELFK